MESFGRISECLCNVERARIVDEIIIVFNKSKLVRFDIKLWALASNES